MRLPGPREVSTALMNGDVGLIAGVKPALEAEARRIAGSRLLPEAFMAIRQAMGTPKGRTGAAAYAAEFIAALKREGFLREAFARNRIEGASLAP